MVSKESSPYLQELDIDEAEETLSLSDFSIYNDATTSEESYHEESQPLDQPFFEFFSEEWSSNSISSPPDSIIFCGKTITSKEPIVEDSKTPKTNHETRPKKFKSLFRWNSESSSTRSKSKNAITTTRRSKSLPIQTGNNDGSRKKGKFAKGVTFLASPVKSRWFFFIFGLARFNPMKMELVDIKSRQVRKNQSMVYQHEDGDAVAAGGGRKGLWGLVEALSCGGGHHANAVVTASFRVIPPV